MIFKSVKIKISQIKFFVLNYIRDFTQTKELEILEIHMLKLWTIYYIKFYDFYMSGGR